jgi:hypothetical protein
MVTSASPEPHVKGQRHTVQFLLGLGLGIIPSLLVLVSAYGGHAGGSMEETFNGTELGTVLVIAGGALYLVALIATIVCLRIARVHAVGIGLLVAVAASPLLFVMSALVSLRGFSIQ